MPGDTFFRNLPKSLKKCEIELVTSRGMVEGLLGMAQKWLDAYGCDFGLVFNGMCNKPIPLFFFLNLKYGIHANPMPYSSGIK